MRFVKAAKASPHAKFYNSSTGWTTKRSNRENISKI